MYKLPRNVHPKDSYLHLDLGVVKACEDQSITVTYNLMQQRYQT